MKRNLHQLILMAIIAMYTTGLTGQIVITEIMYNPPESNSDTLEFLELYNTSSDAINMEGYMFTQGIEITFGDTVIQPSTYLVIAVNDSAFYNVFGFLPIKWDAGGLKNSGEILELQNSTGATIDLVGYDDSGDWPAQADGDGSSLVLCDYNANNSLGTNWLAATTTTGVTINEKELFANPGADSDCPSAMEAVDDSAETATNFATVIDVLANDIIPSGNVTEITLGTPTMGGSVSIDENFLVTYTPPTDQCGIAEAFDYTVNLDNGQTGTASALVFVNCIEVKTIAEVTMEDTDGNATSYGDYCHLTGNVYGVDLNGGDGLQFTLIDQNGDGIVVFSGESFDYTVTEGDELTVSGQIGQYNGLTQIYPLGVTFNSSGNTLLDPQVVTALGEDTESKLVALNNVYPVDASDWDPSGSGFNMDVTNGTDTFTMRIDNEVDLFQLVENPCSFDFNLIGLGGQYDTSDPRTSGYQIFPRYTNDIDCILSTNNPGLAASIELSPNPVDDQLTISATNQRLDRIQVVDMLGRVILHINQPDRQEDISVSHLSSGMYMIQVFSDDHFGTVRFQKN